uniref:hypothetical protein n=1 Tax=Pedobacter schmidteae TaxID=2201271 RepID=UPI000EACA7ED|nr:hypothetical protein [Pedobacter schmidteae]
MTQKIKITTRIWSFIKNKDSFVVEEFMAAMGLKEKEAMEILQQLHDQGYITLKWIEAKGKLSFVKTKPFNDHVN